MKHFDSHKNNIVVETELPSVRGMRVDQLLTSEHFGLHSTLDPDIEAKYEEYYKLLSVQDRSLAQQNRLNVLTREIERFRIIVQVCQAFERTFWSPNSLFASGTLRMYLSTPAPI